MKTNQTTRIKTNSRAWTQEFWYIYVSQLICYCQVFVSLPSDICVLCLPALQMKQLPVWSVSGKQLSFYKWSRDASSELRQLKNWQTRNSAVSAPRTEARGDTSSMCRYVDFLHNSLTPILPSVHKSRPLGSQKLSHPESMYFQSFLLQFLVSYLP